MEESTGTTGTEGMNEKLFVVLCSSGFENMERMRSALMFSSVAASAGYRSVLYCVQSAVDVMVRGAIERHEKPVPGMPTLTQRMKEAQKMGVEVQCCSQSVINKKLTEDDLVDGAVVAGAMNLVHLSVRARATLSF
jgi:predicted peroxiredoxin